MTTHITTATHCAACALPLPRTDYQFGVYWWDGEWRAARVDRASFLRTQPAYCALCIARAVEDAAAREPGGPWQAALAEWREADIDAEARRIRDGLAAEGWVEYRPPSVDTYYDAPPEAVFVAGFWLEARQVFEWYETDSGGYDRERVPGAYALYRRAEYRPPESEAE